VELKCVRFDGGFSCAECEFQTRHQTNMKNHIESKHLAQGVKIPCLYCHLSCPTRSAMRAHVKRQHTFKGLQYEGQS